MVVGPAGSGKDTVAAIVARSVNGQTLALADPMKRLAKILFSFSDEQLWGPSEMRNAADQYWTADRMRNQLQNLGELKAWNWLEDVLPGLSREERLAAGAQLGRWYSDTLVECVKRGVMTPRYVLQTLGTEWGRAFSKNIWIDYGVRMAQRLLSDGGYTYARSVPSGLRYRTKEEVAADLVIITDGRFRNEVLAIKAVGGQVWRIEPVTAALALRDQTGKAGVVGHASETEQQGIPDTYFDLVISNDKAKGLAALEKTIGQYCVSPYVPSYRSIYKLPPVLHT
jgi:hypothetical protein